MSVRSSVLCILAVAALSACITSEAERGSQAESSTEVSAPVAVVPTSTPTSAATDLPAPTITSVSPATGAVGANGILTIVGTGFVAGLTVTVHGRPCVVLVFNSSMQFTCRRPVVDSLGANLVGVGNVVIENPDDQTVTLSNGFAYVVPASLSISDGDLYDYGIRAQGSSTDKTFTIANGGAVQATGLAAGAPAMVAPFGFKGGTYPGTGGTCGATLDAGANCTVVVTYSPTAYVASLDALRIVYNDGFASRTVSRALRGTSSLATPVLSVSVDDSQGITSYDYNSYNNYGVTFPSVSSFPDAGAFLDKTFTVTNGGLAAATSVAMTITSTPANEFIFKGGVYPGTGGTCGNSISSSCTIVVRYKPSVLTLATGTLQITSSAPTQNVSLSGQVNRVSKVAAGYRHTCAVYTTGRVRCWGLDAYGDGILGDGNGVSSVNPVLISNITDAVDITAGRNHTCVKRSGGTVMCWGDNFYGQLGIGSTADQRSPALISGLTVSSVYAGGDSTCALLPDNTVKCWGRNSSGQIGDGTVVDKLAPTSVVFGAPSLRRGHVAEWVDSKMIVWGGYGGTTRLNTGGVYDPVADIWRHATPTASVPAARDGHTSVGAGTKMFVWGGYDGSTYLNTGSVYNSGTATWSDIAADASVAARNNHTAVFTGMDMIVWGGYDGTNYLNSGGVYNPTTVSWATTSTPIQVSAARSSHTVVWTGAQMIAWGGQTGATRLSTGSVYDLATNTWVRATSATNAPTARSAHTAVWTGSRMVVWGGYSGAAYLNTGAVYDPVTGLWTAMNSAGAPSPRADHTVVWTGSKMIVWGGYNGTTYLNTGGIYNPATNTWAAIAIKDVDDNDLAIRGRHTAVWTGYKMIIWGGYNGSAYLNSGVAYDLASDSWTHISNTGAPTVRSRHAGAWMSPSGSKMIVWGGYDGTSYLNTGGVYDLGTDTWTAMATAGAPPGRRSHVAVWTGSRMVFWGGYNGSVYLNTGGVYDPDANAWTATSTGASVPSIRSDHAALWTGTEMIVWGGYNGASDLSTGGVYNPSADTWAATSSDAAAPSVRRSHTAVWTGSKMIVWGGYNGSARLGDGGLYDPATRIWTTVQATGAPAARDTHTAVWTGSKMVVWGGYSGAAYLNTGGVYDPVANTWTATTATNAPAIRNAHTAVWTGSKVIVWGGYNGTTYLNTGGVYDPVANTWTAVQTTNAPTVRSGHSAVWTGSKMIVWGGYNGSAYLNTGGVYDPVANTWTSTVVAEVPVSLSVGYAHACATITGGLAKCWGSDLYGQLGNDVQYIDWLSPVAVTSLAGKTYSSISAGAANTCALYSDGTMHCWGSRLADQQPVPALGTTDVAVGGTVTALASGSQHSCARLSTGDVKCWGANANRQLGDLSTTDSAAPVQVAGVASVASIALGGNQTCALLTGGEAVKCWGYNANTGVASDPASVTGLAQLVTAAPSARNGHAVVVAGNTMIVWGGYNGSLQFMSGGIYSRTTSSWSNVINKSATSSMLVNRKGHAAVWTGSKMLVWGGSSASGSEFLNSGGIYDPALNTWADISTVNGPVARTAHTAVWTDLKMIVWGGNNGVTNLNSGGVYDLSSGAWTAVSATAAPTARSGHAAVWTGSKMLVWGGYSGTTYRNDGGVYNLSTDVWTPISAVGAPTVRSGHVAVWTGSKMLVWGGYNGTTYLNDGAAYDPATDTWTALSTVGAPTERSGHTVVWTGTKMIVWGGYNGATYLNTGAQYDPVGNTWVAMTTADVPSGRVAHTAVWTGTKMIIWGGNDGSGYFQDGAEYDPSTDTFYAGNLSGS